VRLFVYEFFGGTKLLNRFLFFIFFWEFLRGQLGVELKNPYSFIWLSDNFFFFCIFEIFGGPAHLNFMFFTMGLGRGWAWPPKYGFVYIYIEYPLNGFPKLCWL
jgi:hypothetical protein